MIFRSGRLRALKQKWDRSKPEAAMRDADYLKEPVSRIRQHIEKRFDEFGRSPYLLACCNICASHTAFFCPNKDRYRESLNCAVCLTTSRYRSIARGILRAIDELRGVSATALSRLNVGAEVRRLVIYDTQVPSYWKTCAYPIPEILARCKWMEVHTSIYRPRDAMGMSYKPTTTNQNLERLTFPDNRFDIVITSDVMEHVRLDDRAHREIARVLKPGGIYLFTVPHFRDVRQTYLRVQVVDPDDPSQDVYLTEKEYHGDANAEEGRALSYRSYGTDIDETLGELGFSVDYTKQDFPEAAIMNTELFYCRLSG
jgi:SAM-dependent methyltransferase